MRQYRRKVWANPVNWCKKALGVTLHTSEYIKALRKDSDIFEWLDENGFTDETIQFVKDSPCYGQADILEGVRDHRLVSVASSNAIGKTYTSAASIPWYLNAVAPGYVITSSSSWLGVKRSVWPELRRILSSAPVQEIATAGELLSTEWKIGDQWGAFSASPDRPENFSGFRTPNGVFVLVDEASALDGEIMDAIRGLTATEGSRVLLIGNPLNPEGPFFDSFGSKAWHSMTLSAFDSPNVLTGKNTVPGLATREWILECREEWSEGSQQWRARVMGQFPDDMDNAFMPLSMVLAASKRHADMVARGEVGIGVDIGLGRPDKTTYYATSANKVLYNHSKETPDLMEVVEDVISLIARFNPAFVSVDDTGMVGVVARLHQMGYGPNGTNKVFGVISSQRALGKERFYNRRAEMWWNGFEWLNAGGSINDDKRLIADLTATKKKYLSGRVVAESKDELRKPTRLGRSTDDADGFLLSIYDPRFFCDTEPVRVSIDLVEEFGMFPDLMQA